ncbi:hypothetical protein C8J55DRAFT_150524 [Lentinula edodes]|uniref:Uncharacterized protein n=1 Tax=Lentinula lateritia TaxID=40482 RepID=A0A9W9DI10_9AGAR|nr:hypothetical protein C8J55DRAFT_150524 [Lentinula edodes]
MDDWRIKKGHTGGHLKNGFCVFLLAIATVQKLVQTRSTTFIARWLLPVTFCQLPVLRWFTGILGFGIFTLSTTPALVALHNQCTTRPLLKNLAGASLDLSSRLLGIYMGMETIMKEFSGDSTT